MNDKVQLVAETVGVGKYEDLNSEEIVAAIARHGVIKEDNGKLVRYLMDHRHWSPLDMINFVFEIETSRDIGRQILRHKSCFFQEHSTRYSNRVKFEAIEIRKEDKVNRQSSTEVFDPKLMDYGFYFEDVEEFGGECDIKASVAINHCLSIVEELYHKLIEAGVAKECARGILPGCLTSTMSINGTLRSWLSFLNVRLDKHAQKEVQIIAKAIGTRLYHKMPNVFSKIDWENGFFM